MESVDYGGRNEHGSVWKVTSSFDANIVGLRLQAVTLVPRLHVERKVLFTQLVRLAVKSYNPTYLGVKVGMSCIGALHWRHLNVRRVLRSLPIGEESSASHNGHHSSDDTLAAAIVIVARKGDLGSSSGCLSDVAARHDETSTERRVGRVPGLLTVAGDPYEIILSHNQWHNPYLMLTGLVILPVSVEA